MREKPKATLPAIHPAQGTFRNTGPIQQTVSENLPVRLQGRVGEVGGRDKGVKLSYLECQCQSMLCCYIGEQIINKQNLVDSLVAFLARLGR